MSVSLHPLPLVQNWDCHVCGNCCKEYHVVLSEEERRRIAEQGWENDPLVAGMPLFTRFGPPWARRYELSHREDGSCIFLSEQGRCRIHERFGSEAKPLPCRLYPFILVPAGNHWRVGLRFACPSATESRGRQAGVHAADLQRYAVQLVERERLARSPAGPAQLGMPPPALQGRQRVDWPDLFRFVEVLLGIIHDPRDRVERRLRKCLALAGLCRQASFEQIKGGRLKEFLQIVTTSLDAQVPADPTALARPRWVGRVLFRQALALFSRKDRGPNRGIAAKGRLALLMAATRFALGRGRVPKVSRRLPDVTFEEAERPAGPLPPDAEQQLERYYAIKIESLQFCGPTYFGVPFWEGLEALCVTLPVVLWLRRVFADVPTLEGITRALTMADDHFGFNRVLGSLRQRLGFRILTRTGELERLIAWYSR
jgi:lysine-N-methylase